MLFSKDVDGSIVVVHSSDDPTVLFDKHFNRIPLDEEHPEYRMQEGDIAVYTVTEKFSYSYCMAYVRDGLVYTRGLSDFHEILNELARNTDILYDYELIHNGIPIMDNVVFDSMEEANEFIKEQQLPDDVKVRRVKREDYY